MIPRYLPVVLVFLLVSLAVIPGVSAITANKTNEISDVSTYDFYPDDGYVIYEILVQSIAMGQNQTHHLYNGDSEFILAVGTYTEYGVYHNFDITITYPSGNTSTTHATWIGVSSGSYTLDIQPVFYHAQDVNYEFSVYVNVGLTNPLLVEFFTLPADVCTGGDYCSNFVAATSAIPFTHATGSMGETTTVYVYQITEQGFQDNIKKYNGLYGWSALSEEVVLWMYNQAIFFIGLIPVVGPIAVTMIGFIGLVLTELIFWLSWIMVRLPAILLAVETVILLCVVANSNSLKSMGRNLIEYNRMVILGFFWLFNTILAILAWIYDLITKIIAAVK